MGEHNAVIFTESGIKIDPWQVLTPSQYGEYGSFPDIAYNYDTSTNQFSMMVSSLIFQKKRRVIFLEENFLSNLETPIKLENGEKDKFVTFGSMSLQEKMSESDFMKVIDSIKLLKKMEDPSVLGEQFFPNANGAYIKRIRCDDYGSFTDFNFQNLFLVNWSQEIFMDMNKYLKETANNWVHLNPLPMFTTLSSSYLDYEGENRKLIGDWAYDLLSFEQEPEVPFNFEEIFVRFSTNTQLPF